MHYSQGRDRWFGRKHSAPTVGGNAICLLSLTAMGFARPKTVRFVYSGRQTLPLQRNESVVGIVKTMCGKSGVKGEGGCYHVLKQYTMPAIYTKKWEDKKERERYFPSLPFLLLDFDFLFHV